MDSTRFSLCSVETFRALNTEQVFSQLSHIHGCELTFLVVVSGCFGVPEGPACLLFVEYTGSLRVRLTFSLESPRLALC